MIRTYRNPKKSKSARAIDAVNAAHVAWAMVQKHGLGTKANWEGVLTDALSVLKTIHPLHVERAMRLHTSERTCNGHPAGSTGSMGETVYCDGSCC